MLIFDAAGLALFCVADAQKALVFGLDPVMAALLGMLTGVGGGDQAGLASAGGAYLAAGGGGCGEGGAAGRAVGLVL